jgi:hypothetical protein
LVDPAKTKAPLITHPPLVNVRIVAGLQAQDPRALVQVGTVEHKMDIRVAPLGATCTHGRGAREVPDPGLEPEIPVGEGAHRADVNDIA